LWDEFPEDEFPENEFPGDEFPEDELTGDELDDPLLSKSDELIPLSIPRVGWLADMI